MTASRPRVTDSHARRRFIGGSDARIIMGHNEAALLRLWREKRGEAEPEDLSDNLIVQLGFVTETLNRFWFECAIGLFIVLRPQRSIHDDHCQMIDGFGQPNAPGRRA